jgi:glutathione S-transferase
VPLMYVGDDPNPKTQANAMLHYVASLKPDVGLNPADKVFEIEEAMGIVGDLIRVWSPCLYMGRRPHLYGRPEDFGKTHEGQDTVKDMRQTFIKEGLPPFLKFIADYIDAHGDGTFLCGDKPTIADCLAVPVLRRFTCGIIDHVPAECLEIEPRIIA